MMLSALECRVCPVFISSRFFRLIWSLQNRNLTFASVHDSYWTHACDVDKMSEIIRETFIALHSSDILSKLDKEVRFTIIFTQCWFLIRVETVP